MRAQRLVFTGAGLGFLIAGPFQLGGARCTLAPAPNLRLRPELSDELHVLHVGAEFGEAAGYPISPTMVISSGHQLAGRIRAVAVEGFPMIAGNYADRISLNRDQLATRDDWVVLMGTAPRCPPILTEPQARPKPGESA